MEYGEKTQVEEAFQFEPEVDFPTRILNLTRFGYKYWKIITVITLSVTLITAIATMFMPNIYSAKTLVIPNDEDKAGVGVLMSQLGGLAAMAGAGGGTKATGEMYITMLKTETVKDRIIDRFKLLSLYKAKYRADVYKKLDSKALFNLGKKDGVITITVSDRDPKLAAALANAYVEELIELTSRLNMSKASENRLFLEKRLAEAHTDLSKAEEMMKAFQNKNKVISINDQAQAAISSIAQLQALLASKEVELANLKRQFTDSSQEVKTAQSSIANIRSQIARLESTADSRTSQLTIGAIPDLGQQYFRILREYKIQEAVMEMLTKQYEAAKISEDKDLAQLQVLQKAKVPEKKSKPIRTQIVKIALLLSFMFSVFVAFVIEKTKPFVETLDREKFKELLRS